jgi:hypothetical protein
MLCLQLTIYLGAIVWLWDWCLNSFLIFASLLSCGYDVAMPPYDSWGGIATS